jgi:hypothetical protein
MKMVEGGPAAVNVTFTPPACAAVKGRKSLLPTATIPENVSVVCVADGDVVLSLRLALEPEKPYQMLGTLG